MAETEKFISILEIKQLESGALFKSIVVVRKIAKKTGKNGNNFFQIEVGDATDGLAFNCFEGNDSFDFFRSPPKLCPLIIKLEGWVDFYAEKLSPRIKSVEAVAEELYEHYLPRVLEVPEEPLADLKKALEGVIQQIRYSALAKTVRQVFIDLGPEFFDSVAAVSMHHAYIHGLLEHTVHVARVVHALLPLYTNLKEISDLALAGALLHDVGKVLEYRYANNGIERTPIGHLQGHVVLGYRLVRSAGLRQKLNQDWLERLEHIILSHQGELEWGAVVHPSTPEAILVSLADNLDARMAMVQQQMKKTMSDQVFSDFVTGLNARLMTKHLPKEEGSKE